jgi:ferrochelatase
MRIAVLMLNLGGPQSLAEVRPFLRQLFLDREIIRFPGGALGQRLFARLIARRKAHESEANYAAIGGRSPLLDWTRRQGAGMADLVRRQSGVEILPLPCMRYWHPLADEALQQAADWGAEHLVAFTQYPHFSTTTTGSSLAELQRAAARRGVRAPISAIRGFHDHPDYVSALAATVRDAVQRLPAQHRAQSKVVYSAHSLPMKFVRAGDPYPEQIRASAELAHRRSGCELPFEVAWQSKVGPVEWLQPSTIDRIRALPQEGVQHAAVVPISFVNDHIETLQELDLALAAEARAAGIRTFARAPALNVRPDFLQALANVLLAHLRSQGLLAAAPAH